MLDYVRIINFCIIIIIIIIIISIFSTKTCINDIYYLTDLKPSFTHLVCTLIYTKMLTLLTHNNTDRLACSTQQK